jgi:hypothetical protein
MGRGGGDLPAFKTYKRVEKSEKKDVLRFKDAVIRHAGWLPVGLDRFMLYRQIE